MGSNVKRQKEDAYQYGGERKGQQVIANSFIPTLIAIFIVFIRWNSISIYGYSIETIESTRCILSLCNRSSLTTYCIILLYRVLCRYMGK